MKTYTHIYLSTTTYTYICLHIAAYAYMLSTGGRSPEARWRSQTEVVLRARLIYVASGVGPFLDVISDPFWISVLTYTQMYIHIPTYIYI